LINQSLLKSAEGHYRVYSFIILDREAVALDIGVSKNRQKLYPVPVLFVSTMCAVHEVTCSQVATDCSRDFRFSQRRVSYEDY